MDVPGIGTQRPAWNFVIVFITKGNRWMSAWWNIIKQNKSDSCSLKQTLQYGFGFLFTKTNDIVFP
jgi:hypothetical protein